MKDEVLAAVMFLIRFIEKSDSFPREQIENFKTHLTSLLMQRFEKHWFPEIPAKGQGYRCIRLNCLMPVDKSLEQAASRCGLRYRDLSLPTELTVWVDPNEVCYRLGESEGSYCTLATFATDLSSSASDTSSASSSPLSSPPSTPIQEKLRRHAMAPLHHQQQQHLRHLAHHHPQQQQQQRVIAVDAATINNNSSSSNNNNKLPPRNHFNFINTPNTAHPIAALRTKPISREMSFNYQNRPPWRCEPSPFPVPPTIYRHYNNYNATRPYKNILKV